MNGNKSKKIVAGVIDIVPRDVLGIRQPVTGLSFSIALQSTGDLMSTKRLLAVTELQSNQTLLTDGTIRFEYISLQVISIWI